jgi:hypothetical protein
MGNERFDDISILKTLQELRNAKLLHPDDQAALIRQLKSDWGRSAAKSLLEENETEFAASRSILQKFSNAF